VSNLVRLAVDIVDPEEIAAARHPTERDQISDSDSDSDSAPVDDQIDADDASAPLRRAADRKMASGSSDKSDAGRGAASCRRIARTLFE
jgi:hypothetical protein